MLLPKKKETNFVFIYPSSVGLTKNEEKLVTMLAEKTNRSPEDIIVSLIRLGINSMLDKVGIK